MLLDTTARVDERDDAAMDLGFFDTPDVEQALGLIGSDESAPENSTGVLRRVAGTDLVPSQADECYDL